MQYQQKRPPEKRSKANRIPSSHELLGKNAREDRSMADQATKRYQQDNPWNPNKQKPPTKQPASVQRKVQRRIPEPELYDDEDDFSDYEEEEEPVHNTGRYQKQVPMNLPERRVIRPPQQHDYIDAQVQYIGNSGYQRAMPAQEVTYEQGTWLITPIFFYGSIGIAIISFFILVFRHLHILFH